MERLGLSDGSTVETVEKLRLSGGCIVEAVETLGLSGGCVVESVETLGSYSGSTVESVNIASVLLLKYRAPISLGCCSLVGNFSGLQRTRFYLIFLSLFRRSCVSEPNNLAKRS